MTRSLLGLTMTSLCSMACFSNLALAQSPFQADVQAIKKSYVLTYVMSAGLLQGLSDEDLAQEFKDPNGANFWCMTFGRMNSSLRGLLNAQPVLTKLDNAAFDADELKSLETLTEDIDFDERLCNSPRSLKFEELREVQAAAQVLVEKNH